MPETTTRRREENKVVSRPPFVELNPMSNAITSIVMPMTGRDLVELRELFDNMEQPLKNGTRLPLFLTLDTAYTKEQRQFIHRAAVETGVDQWFDLILIDCHLAVEESFYLRKMPADFDRARFPYGLKSGPNIQFFRSLEIVGCEPRRPFGAVLLLETDMTPVVPCWIDRINDELTSFGNYLVCGSAYKGRAVLPTDIRDHINGASVYNLSNPNFDSHLKNWRQVVIAACTHAPWHAYDVIPEWARVNQTSIANCPEAAPFLAGYENACHRIESIANFSGPTERQRGDVSDFSAMGKVALVHLRVPPSIRAYWRYARAAAERATSVSSAAVNRDWQYPAITEKHAFSQLSTLISTTAEVAYLGFPWATYIDQLLHRPDEAVYLRALLKEKAIALSGSNYVVTVCQHIHMDLAVDEMIDAGITHVFWTHHVKDGHDKLRDKAITILPFPLYPVQVPPQGDPARERPHLFSFIGSYAPKYYLSQSRNHIIDELAKHPRGRIVERRQWHYNTVVYKHQIGKTTKDGEQLVDEQRSLEFRQSLSDSIFSLCPSGSGPNSIRLWESIGAGAIPVILADTYLPPGPEALWQQAVVFCTESREAIRALPERLEEIAADPEKLAAMRHAMRQLWALYGPGAFTHDVEVALLDLGGTQPIPHEADFLIWLAQGQRGEGKDRWSRTVLNAASTLLLIAPDTAAAVLERPEVAAALDIAAAAHKPAAARLDRMRLAAPQIDRKAPISVHLFGRHAKRTPVSYPAFRNLMQDRLRIVESPAKADVHLSGFNIDLKENAELLDGTRAKAAIISEEPLWDTLWSGGFTERERVVDIPGGALRYTFLNHATSAIFRFDKLPYFPLTDSRMPVRYRQLLAAQTGISAADLLARWRAMPIPAAFCAECREGPNYAQVFPDLGVWGLSHYRTTVARSVKLPGTVRMGKGWSADAGPRQKLVDWHLDKIATFNQRVRILSAYENTHQKHYISEKIFDAFAFGAIPATFTSPDHRLWELVEPSAALNTFAMTEAEAALAIANFEPDIFIAEAHLRTQARMLRLLSDHSLILAERKRIADAVMAELSTLA